MKRISLYLTAGLCTLALAAAALFAQAHNTADWHIRKPLDTAQYKYIVGMSAPFAAEKEALADARRDAVQQFAASIATRFEGKTDITVQSEFMSSGIEDAHTVYMETASFSINVPVTGMSILDQKTERDANGRYVVRVLAVMTAADYDKAKRFVDNEEAAYLAYGFFGQRGLFAYKANTKPSGFEDYHSWLRSTCMIVSVDDADSPALLTLLDAFIKKLYKNAVLFAQIIEGRGARIVYDSTKYYDGVLRALQDTGLFTIRRETTQLILKPNKQNAAAELKNAVAVLPDSGKFVIAGIERIQTDGGETHNAGTIIMNQFKVIASRQFTLQAAQYSFPGNLLADGIDEDGIIRHVQNNLAAFPARYLVLCSSETKLSRGMAEYKMPPMVSASCYFTLYDIVTGETIHSDKAQTASGAFSPSDLSDRAVLEESRNALRFLFNAKTRPGLEEIMRGVLGRL